MEDVFRFVHQDVTLSQADRHVIVNSEKTIQITLPPIIHTSEAVSAVCRHITIFNANPLTTHFVTVREPDMFNTGLRSTRLSNTRNDFVGLNSVYYHF